jgi:hypothetical protein
VSAAELSVVPEQQDGFARLREPFPPEMVGKLPKGGTELDYVGHGAVTDRLLEVDPHWNWEPVAVDEHGLPMLDKAGNLWIRLTVNGVTRLGVGDGQTMKVLIGDAIRNAAMRFGVALDLWIRGHAEDDEQVTERRTGRRDPMANAAEHAALRDALKSMKDNDPDALKRFQAWHRTQGMPAFSRSDSLSEPQYQSVVSWCVENAPDAHAAIVAALDAVEDPPGADEPADDDGAPF